MGTIVFPSVKDKTEISGPSRNSSMTTRSPLLPKRLPCIISRTACSACARSWAMITPFPSASPSALMTVGMGAVLRYVSAASRSSKVS